jgi:hypothetical protein
MRKHRWLLWLIAIGWLPVLFWFKTPKQAPSEIEEPLFTEAQRCLRTDRTDEAFQLLNRLVEKRKAPCPETHFQLGQLSVKSDPIGAIYHFQRYLSQTTDGARSKIAMQLIETAKKEFARTLPLGNRTAETPEYIRLTEVLKQMREENARLKAQLAQTRLSYAPAKEATEGTFVSTATPSEASRERTYVVQHDDSLSKISLKMYGSAVKWKLIYEANRDILPSANSLKIGMKLRIPALETVK